MQHTLPTKTLIKASIIAIIIAIIALVSFILPAEYNIDPLGIGNKLGLTKLAATKPVDTPPVQATTKEKASDTIELTIPAGRGIEYKFHMTQFAKMEYEWLTDGEALYFDLHGEPEGDTSGYYESYTLSTSNEVKGSFITPFTGTHGWYWKNKSDQDVNIQLIVNGEYTILGLKK